MSTTKVRIGGLLSLAVLASGISFAQFGREGGTFQPRFTSPDRNALTGRCYLRVRVDDEAEISMRGDQVSLRTLRGRPTIDAGSECTGPLPPRGITDFDFRQTDGPGRAEVIRRPDPGDGTVVIRVRDPDGGDHKYTLEFQWAVGNRGGGGDYRDNRPRDDRDGDRGGRDYGRDNRGPDRAGRAIRLCTETVTGRVTGRYGFRNFEVEDVRVDDRPGRADFIVGRGFAGDRDRRARFEFFCQVDLQSGELRDVNVRQR